MFTPKGADAAATPAELKANAAAAAPEDVSMAIARAMFTPTAADAAATPPVPKANAAAPEAAAAEPKASPPAMFTPAFDPFSLKPTPSAAPGKHDANLSMAIARNETHYATGYVRADPRIVNPGPNQNDMKQYRSKHLFTAAAPARAALSTVQPNIAFDPFTSDVVLPHHKPIYNDELESLIKVIKEKPENSGPDFGISRVRDTLLLMGYTVKPARVQKIMRELQLTQPSQ